MKKDKLQKVADKVLSPYDATPEFKEKLRQMAREKYPKKSDHRKRNWTIGLSTAAVCCIAIILCVSLLIPGAPADKKYALENRVTETTTVEVAETALRGIMFNSQWLSGVGICSDNFYNEDLYYYLDYNNEDNFETLYISIVINSDFKYEFQHSEYDKQSEFYDMKYVEDITESDGLYTFHSQGEFAFKSYKIYVDYNGIGFDEQSNFLSFLQECMTLQAD